MKRILLPIGLAALALGALDGVPAHAARAPAPGPARVMRATTPFLRSGRRLPVFTHLAAAGPRFWAGYIDVADSGKVFSEAGTSFTVPKLDCADSIMGSQGSAFIDTWVGIDGYGTSDIGQTGVEAYCTGPAGGWGTAGPFINAWYTNTGQIYEYSGQPALSGGNSVVFSVSWDPSTHKFSYAYIDKSHNNAEFKASLGCPAGDTCTGSTAEVITEVPGGGPPGYQLPSWNPWQGPPAYHTTFVKATDGSSGTLNSLSGQWTLQPTATMNFTCCESGKLPQEFGYNIVGQPEHYRAYSMFGYGLPEPLSSDGSSFETNCYLYLYGAINANCSPVITG